MSRRSVLACVALAVAAAAAGCGSNASGTTATHATTPTTAAVAGPVNGPSAQALMICADEAEREIASTLGVQTAKPVVGQWNKPVYSCQYKYANGSMTLSVREFNVATAATSYFAQLRSKLHAATSDAGLGQGTAQAPNGTVIVVKDNKV